MSINFRRHYPTLIVLIVVVSVLVFAMGNMRVIAYTTSKSSPITANRGSTDYTNDIPLFDNTVVHSIRVIMSDEDYDSMITTYQQTGVKEYFKADVIIDGVQINNVGIRLKGNASLRTAIGGGMGGGGNPPNNGAQPNNGQRPNNGQQPNNGALFNNRPQAPNNGNMPQAPGNQQNGPMPGDDANRNNFQPPQNFQRPDAGQGPDQNGGFGQTSVQGKTKIPFMIKFDKYEDQTYQGYTNVAIRTYGTSYNEAMLAEPVTNTVARLAGIPATDTAYVGFKINDNEETLYVISDLVNEGYLEKYFENTDGILYKAEIGSTLSYQGEDPSSYAKSFTQQTRVNDADLAPLIDFMRFLDQADDTTFESELPKRLDVDSFATYLAVNALLVNTDSMIGMNNNYYLYYDEGTEQFTVLMWDANESLGKLGGNTSSDVSLSNLNSGPGGGARGGGMGRGQNALITRFMENATFKALYEEKLKEVYQITFIDGVMSQTVDQYSELIHSVNDERNLVDMSAYDQAVEQARNFISQRMEYLNTLDWLKQ